MFGFKISSLSKLSEFKTNKPSVTLLHFLVEEATKTNPNILDFLTELKDLSLIYKYWKLNFLIIY